MNYSWGILRQQYSKIKKQILLGLKNSNVLTLGAENLASSNSLFCGLSASRPLKCEKDASGSLASTNNKRKRDLDIGDCLQWGNKIRMLDMAKGKGFDRRGIYLKS